MTGRCIAWSAGASCASAPHPVAPTSSRWTTRRGRSPRPCSGGRLWRFGPPRGATAGERWEAAPGRLPRAVLGGLFNREPFYAFAARDGILRGLVEALNGFRPPLSPEPFETLVTSISAQQVSL